MKRLLLVYNTHAGRRKIRAMLPDILDVFSQNGYLTTVVPTQAPGDAARTTAALSASFERVVCCGGDGTLNDTVSGLMMMPVDLRPVLGYIPTGTTNDFSRNLNLPRGTEKLAQNACAGVPRAIDMGHAAGRWFTYVAAFGLFTDVSYSTPQNSKNLLGHAAYLIEGASRLSSVQTYRVKVEWDDQRVEDEFIYGMVSNTISVGGLLNLSKASVSLDDGLFEVLLVRTPREPADYQTIIHALMTREVPPSGEGNGLILSFAASSVTFSCDVPVPWTLDGEFGGEHVQLSVENRRQAVTLACGK